MSLRFTLHDSSKKKSDWGVKPVFSRGECCNILHTQCGSAGVVQRFLWWFPHELHRPVRGAALWHAGYSICEGGQEVPNSGNRDESLGFDLSQFDEGVVYIRHTPERREELLAKINNILSQDSLSPKEAESFKGRIQWFESYLFGRIANLSIYRIGKRAQLRGAKVKNKLDEELRSSLLFLRDRVQTGSPLILTANTENAILIFTDGAFDAETLKGSVGGVLLSRVVRGCPCASSVRTYQPWWWSGFWRLPTTQFI